jgi:hypothetical protein
MSKNCTQTGTINDPLLNLTSQPLIEPEVIKGSENLKSSDLKTELDDVANAFRELLKLANARSECDHLTGSWVPVVMNDDERWLEFTYCPKCGEKL